MSSTTTSTVKSPAVTKMRKGTRSCRECRRRKIRCIYTNDQSQVCKECLHHGRQCVSQGIIVQPGEKTVSENRSNLRIRVAKLESMIERLAKAHPERAAALLAAKQDATQKEPEPPPPSHMQTGLQELNELDIQSQARSPLFVLFNNEVLTRSNGDSFTPLNTSSIISFGSANSSDREKLLSTIAQEPHILDVLDAAGTWWLCWQDQFSGFKDLVGARSLRDFVTSYLADDRPIMIACGLCCIAMSLQHLREGIDDMDLQLSTSPKQLMDRYLAAVDQLVLSNGEYVVSVDGLLTCLMRAKIYAESNQLRKAWLHIRKAIHVGQNIDLAGGDPSVPGFLNRQRFMGSLFETDRFMSLILGLPYAVNDNFNDKLALKVLLCSTADSTTRMRALRRVTAIAAGNVNDRNAASPDDSARITLKIQQSLDTAAFAMPVSWWGVTVHATNFSDPSASHEHLMTQLWYYQVQCFLQLPFMLKAATDSLYEPSRAACLYSVRQLLKIYNTLRQNATLSAYTCRCEDFQGMLGAIILTVGLLQYSSQGLEPTDSSYDQDLELLDATKQVFEYASWQQGGGIAKQGLNILKSLGDFLNDDANSPTTDESPGRTATFFVPYFGTISVQSSAALHRRLSSRKTANITNPEASTLLYGAHTETSIGSDQSQATPGSDDSPNPDYSSYFWPMVDQTFPISAETMVYPESDGLLLSSPDELTSFTTASSDWDKLMFGAELDQDWNYGMPTTLATV